MKVKSKISRISRISPTFSIRTYD